MIKKLFLWFRNMAKYVKNVICNVFRNFKEFVVYKEEFPDTTQSEQYKEFTKELREEFEEYKSVRGRKFVRNEVGELIPVNENTTAEDLKESIYKSQRRSIDNIFGYGLCNDWSAFLTLTFSPEELAKKGMKRDNNDDVKRLWRTFRRALQRIKPDVGLLAVPEPHKDGCLHFHVLVSNFDFTDYITKIQRKRTKHGNVLYSLNLWKYGYSTVALIPKDEPQIKIVYYLNKYMSKDFNIDYNKKRYFHTHNLEYKTKEVLFMPVDDLAKIDVECEKHKETDKLIVYRQYFEPQVPNYSQNLQSSVITE